MKKSFYLLIVAGLLLSILSCGKYDEGPFFSMRTKKARLDGHWNIVLVYNNNVDVTRFYPDDYGYVFDKNGSFRHIENGNDHLGTWEFNSDKSEILITFENSSKSDAFTVLKLTNKHMWWKRTVVMGDQIDIIEQHFEVKK